MTLVVTWPVFWLLIRAVVALAAHVSAMQCPPSRKDLGAQRMAYLYSTVLEIPSWRWAVMVVLQ